MVVGGASSLERENVSIAIPSTPSLVERERSKTAVSNRALLKRRHITADAEQLIENNHRPIVITPRRSSSVSRAIPRETASRQTAEEDYRQSVPSKISIGTQTIVQDVRQPAVLEAYLPPVIVEKTHKRPSTSKQRREKRRHDETEQNARNDLCTDVTPSYHDPFSPEFFLQRKAAIDNQEYRKIIQSWRAESLNEVIALMSSLSMNKNSIDRAWIVFYWISQNIEYDVHSYFNGNIRHQTPNDIFRNKTGVCDAYGTIFQALCEGVQLESVKVSGYAKGYGYRPGQSTFTRTDHAWNAIRLNKHWYLIDSTWGAGHLDKHNQYEKKLKPHYFLTRPEHMIYDHLPEDPKWQLLSYTVSMQQFIALPQVHSIFFDLQLEIVSHPRTNTVTFDRDRNLAEVLIRTSADVGLSCSVAHDHTSGLVQYDAERKLWQCLFRPRSSGYQRLDIYARVGRSSGSYEGAIEFGLDMPVTMHFPKFPLTYGTFTTNKCQIFEPLADKLRRGTKVTIHCRIPGARCVCLAFDGKLSSQEQNTINDIFKQRITVPNREVTVYVQFANNKTSTSYEGLFKYTVE